MIYKPNYANLAKARLIGACSIPESASKQIYTADKKLDWVIEKNPPQFEEKAKYSQLAIQFEMPFENNVRVNSQYNDTFVIFINSYDPLMKRPVTQNRRDVETSL